MEFVVENDLTHEPLKALVEVSDNSTKKALEMYFTLGSVRKDVLRYILDEKIPGEYLLRCMVFVKDQVDMIWWTIINQLSKREDSDVYMVAEIVQAYLDGIPPQVVQSYIPACRKAFEMSIARKEVRRNKDSDMQLDEIVEQAEDMFERITLKKEDLEKKVLIYQQLIEEKEKEVRELQTQNIELGQDSQDKKSVELKNTINMLKYEKMMISKRLDEEQNKTIMAAENTVKRNNELELYRLENKQLREELETLTNALVSKMEENKVLRKKLAQELNKPEVKEEVSNPQSFGSRVKSYYREISYKKFKKMSAPLQAKEITNMMISSNYSVEQISQVTQGINSGIPREIMYELIQKDIGVNELSKLIEFILAGIKNN